MYRRIVKVVITTICTIYHSPTFSFQAQNLSIPQILFNIHLWYSKDCRSRTLLERLNLFFCSTVSLLFCFFSFLVFSFSAMCGRLSWFRVNF